MLSLLIVVGCCNVFGEVSVQTGNLSTIISKIIMINDIRNKSYMNCGNEMKMKKWLSQWTQFMQLCKEAWKKKFWTSMGFSSFSKLWLYFLRDNCF